MTDLPENYVPVPIWLRIAAVELGVKCPTEAPISDELSRAVSAELRSLRPPMEKN